MVEHLPLDVDTGQSRVNWSGPQVEQAGSAGADQNDPTLDLLLCDLPGQYLPGRNVGCLGEVAEFEIHTTPAIGGDFDVPDANVVETCGLSERGLATRVRCLQHIGACPLGHAHGFCCERGHERVIKPKHECDPANDLVAIGYPV